jgi:hypothetical protein
MAQALTWTSLQSDIRSYIERGNSLSQDALVYLQIPKAIGWAERRIARELKVTGFIQVVASTFAAGTAVYAKPDRWRETVSINFGTGLSGLDLATLSDGGDGYLSVPTVTVHGDGSGAEVGAIMQGRSVAALEVTAPGFGYTSASIAFDDPIGDGAAGTVSIADTNNQRNPLLPRSYEYCRSYWPNDAKTSQPKFYADYNYQHMLIAPTPDQAYPFEMVYWELPPLLDDTLQTNWFTEYAPQLLLYGSLLEMAPFLKDDDRISTWQDMYDRAAQALSGEDLRKIMDRTTDRRDGN